MTAVGPSRVTLPLTEAFMDPVKVLWQTPVSLPPMAKRTEWKYFMPTKGYEFLYSYPAPGSLVVSAANEEITKVSWEQCLKRRIPKGYTYLAERSILQKNCNFT